MAEFQILDSFKITKRGLVIMGDIVSGEIHAGDIIIFNDGEQNRQISIKSIEFVDKIKEGIAHIGLLLNYENDVQKELFSKMKLKRQIVEIKTPNT